MLCSDLRIDDDGDDDDAFSMETISYLHVQSFAFTMNTLKFQRDYLSGGKSCKLFF